MYRVMARAGSINARGEAQSDSVTAELQRAGGKHQMTLVKLARQRVAIELDLVESAIAEVQRQIRGSIAEVERQGFGAVCLPGATLKLEGEFVAQIGYARRAAAG